MRSDVGELFQFGIGPPQLGVDAGKLVRGPLALRDIGDQAECKQASLVFDETETDLNREFGPDHLQPARQIHAGAHGAHVGLGEVVGAVVQCERRDRVPARAVPVRVPGVPHSLP